MQKLRDSTSPRARHRRRLVGASLLIAGCVIAFTTWFVIDLRSRTKVVSERLNLTVGVSTPEDVIRMAYAQNWEVFGVPGRKIGMSVQTDGLTTKSFAVVKCRTRKPSGLSSVLFEWAQVSYYFDSATKLSHYKVKYRGITTPESFWTQGDHGTEQGRLGPATQR